jgi:hypothetical protein
MLRKIFGREKMKQVDSVSVCLVILKVIYNIYHIIHYIIYNIIYITLYISSMAQQSLVGQGFLIIEVLRPHSVEPSGRVISPRRRPLPYNTQHSQERHTCSRRDSNLQSQQASGRRPTP